MTDPASTPDAPAWFQRALADAPVHREVTVEGAAVHYRVWGEPGAPGVVLVHGGAAHSGWWDHVAPQLTGRRVVALDLSGHGDSGRREGYDGHLWAREVVAVAATEGLERPVVIGHSMGGWVAVTVGVDSPGAVSAVAVIDSPLNDTAPDEARLRERRRPHRVYPTAEGAVARFRTLPAQDVLLPYVREHVARGSLRMVEGGWTWKFDPDFFGNRLLLRDLLPRLTPPVTLFRCEHGLVSPDMAAEMTRLVPGALPVAELVDAGHHPMLDQPLALVAALRTLLAVWPRRD
jgi:pimeloyl-ACP methyl ester carboxylesterase